MTAEARHKSDSSFPAPILGARSQRPAPRCEEPMKGPRWKERRLLAFSPSWTSRGQPATGRATLKVDLPAPVKLPQWVSVEQRQGLPALSTGL